MNMTHKVGEAADRLQRRRQEMKADSLDRANDDLSRELKATRNQLEQERSTRAQLLDALTSAPVAKEAKEKVVVKKRRGRLLRVLVIGGGAYVLGARAGHERYEQIKGWASSMRDKVQSRGDELLDDGQEWAATTNGGVDSRSQASSAASTPSSATSKPSSVTSKPSSATSPSGATSKS